MIKILDKKIANKIAAGEVIDRPVSIVKELVENSIDADATSITIEIRKGGKEYIRVTDNGSGIDSEDVETAFRRHATSKINNEEDLTNINTLGFRGEALASICAVSRVELITKRKDARTGRRVMIRESEVLENSPTGCPDGTTITVKDLFYNVPARLKFLSSDGAESRRIIDLASRIALSYPDIRFSVINGSNQVFATSGSGNILECILNVYGHSIGKDLIPFNGNLEIDGENYILKGFASNPGNTLSTRKRQIFSVNGRVVSSAVIEAAIDKAYKERMFPGRFPIVFLFLSVPADKIDVNIHPTKKEIRFDDNSLIEDFIAENISKCLMGEEAIPSAKPKVTEPVTPSVTMQEQTIIDIVKTPHLTDSTSNISTYNAVDDTDNYRNLNEEVDIKNVLTTLRDKQIQEKEEHERAVLELTIKSATYNPFDIDKLNVIGVVFSTYIACQDEENFYLIDQHAAHERVFYEKLLKQYNSEEKSIQTIMIPLNFNVSADVTSTEDLWIDKVNNMGYDVEYFGLNSYIVRGIPAFMELSEAEDFLRDLFNEFEERPDLTNTAVLDRIITRSCKSAVKAGDILKDIEITELLNQLKLCKNPFSCPHGRPTFIKMSQYEIEKMFKRV